MKNLQIFENEQFGKVRTVLKNDESWFVGKDIANALGYKNTKDALLSHVDTEDKDIIQRSEIPTIENHIPKDAFPVDFITAEIPNRGLTIINESGVYSLILRSNLPNAKVFKRWITHDVIPSIRKTGNYTSKYQIPQTYAAALQLAADQAKQLEADKPKVLFADSVSSSHTNILIGELAKLIKQNGYNIGQNRLFKWLRNNGYLVNRQGNDYNMPTQKSMELGLFSIKESTSVLPDGHTVINKTTKVTGKGQIYFVHKFLGEGANAA